MNKLRFKLLVALMSLSLIGIIFVQLYWIKTSYDNNDIQFRNHVSLIARNVADMIKEREQYEFTKRFHEYAQQKGKNPEKKDIREIYYTEKNSNNEIVYSNVLFSQDYTLPGSFFDNKSGDITLKNYSTKRKLEIYANEQHAIEGNKYGGVARDFHNDSPTEVMEEESEMTQLNRYTASLALNDIVSAYPIEDRTSKEEIEKLFRDELEESGINVDFSYGVFNNGAATSIHSNNFVYNPKNTVSVSLFQDFYNNSEYQLYVSFPEKAKFIFSDLMPFVLMSLLFTFVILAAYMSAILQLIRMRQVSEIKNDFINNMTHEFKTPIATINLALDAIKNPATIKDEEKINRYVQMIRDENKRMHAQIENILRMSKLEKRELDIQKEKVELDDIIEVAAEHIRLIVEDRQGDIQLHLQATRNTVLVSPVHFTNVLINMLDNAVKYSPEAPKIDICTENVKDNILIKIKDQGAGMSKTAQKRIFEKFYREHTGDLHNVKGHGLGLAYVKQIVDDHNGEIYVESEKGKGSTFTIKLPLIN